jgi:hypothetical protein
MAAVERRRIEDGWRPTLALAMTCCDEVSTAASTVPVAL